MSNVVDEYKDIERKDEVTRGVRKLRRKFFRYKEAEYVYSIEHKKLLELADIAKSFLQSIRMTSWHIRLPKILLTNIKVNFHL